MSELKFIGGYDLRRNTATIAASDAHAMVKASELKVSKPRKQSHTLDEICERAAIMGVKFELEGKVIYLTPPNSREYYTTKKSNAWGVLDAIASEILAAKSDAEIAAEAAIAHEMIEDIAPPSIIAEASQAQSSEAFNVGQTYECNAGLKFVIVSRDGETITFKTEFIQFESSVFADDKGEFVKMGDSKLYACDTPKWFHTPLDSDIERERLQRFWDRDESRERVEFPQYTYDLMRY